MTRPDILDVNPPQDESNYTVAAADFRAVLAYVEELEAEVARQAEVPQQAEVARQLDDRDLNLLVTCGIVIGIKVIDHCTQEWRAAAKRDIDEGDTGTARELLQSVYTAQVLRQKVARSAARAWEQAPAVLRALGDRGEAGADELLQLLTRGDREGGRDNAH